VIKLGIRHPRNKARKKEIKFKKKERSIIGPSIFFLSFTRVCVRHDDGEPGEMAT
jgi:hypothetical protein